MQFAPAASAAVPVDAVSVGLAALERGGQEKLVALELARLAVALAVGLEAGAEIALAVERPVTPVLGASFAAAPVVGG